MRLRLASLVIGVAVALLIRFIGLLGCGCTGVNVWDFVMVGGFAVMLPDRRK